MDQCVYPKLKDVQQLIKTKAYVQVKVVFEYYHDKPYEPILTTTKKPFYTDKLIQHCNLIQSEEDLTRIVNAQSEQILQL
jgi:hypothetical protein